MNNLTYKYRILILKIKVAYRAMNKIILLMWTILLFAGMNLYYLWLLYVISNIDDETALPCSIFNVIPHINEIRHCSDKSYP